MPAKQKAGAQAPAALRVAFQGEPGAFSQMAIAQLLCDAVTAVPCQTFDQVFRQLTEAHVDASLIPIENTLHGSVHENYDHLLRYNLSIVAETSVRIVHNLIAPRGINFRDVRRVFSHPVALNQCLDFFAAYPRIEKVPYYDTAGSVKMLAEQNLKDAAAIASSLSAKLYGCRILKESIEDDRENYSRFFLLRSPDDPPLAQIPTDRPHKTSLVFTTQNVPGSLFRALSAFALRDVSLTKIESRPLRGKKWEYLFYLDFLGHVEDNKVRNALSNLGEIADFLRVLGCYPRGD